MATTSNFGWTTPDDTDLVKDGALAIRTLGNNIDTSLLDLKGGTTGQILSKNSNTDLDYTWINNDQGDITGIQAGLGISVASATGPVPVVTNDVATEFDAKGDLVVGTGDNTFDRLPVGTTNQVLTVDSTTSTGVKWATPAAASPLTTKGDLYTFSQDNDRVAVGNNGDTLLADSLATTGLRWQGNFAAGKNIVINGDFAINQRSFTSTTTDGTYGFDRFRLQASDGTSTYSAQTFTPGAAPVAGYEAKNFARLASTGQTLTTARTVLYNAYESARILAGQTFTFSFWAKASSGTPSVAVAMTQFFGTGGSPSADVVSALGKQAITTSWARYSFTYTMPSVSGKTFGTNNNDQLIIYIYTSAGSTYATPSSSLGIQTATIDFWGIQLEAGSVATAFQTSTGTLAGELAAARRYYVRFGASDGSTTSAYNEYAYGNTTSTTNLRVGINLQQRMRVAPTSVEYANLLAFELNNTERAVSAVTLQSATNSNTLGSIDVTIAASTNSAMHRLVNNNNTGGYLAFSAEL